MTDHRTSLRTHGPLTAATLVALAALGCGVTGLSERAAEGHRAVGERTSTGPLDVGRPTVANLDPALRDAVQAAARDARADGVRMVVTSGWRSRSHQGRLYTDAVRKYGSEEEARRYVATPDTSAHVTGDAVDIGPTDADSWLSQHGSDYGLCQTFANEMWHYELATTPGGRCPDQLPDGSSRN